MKAYLFGKGAFMADCNTKVMGFRRIRDPEKLVAAIVEIARKKEKSFRTLRTPGGVWPLWHYQYLPKTQISDGTDGLDGHA